MIANEIQHDECIGNNTNQNGSNNRNRTRIGIQPRINRCPNEMT